MNNTDYFVAAVEAVPEEEPELLAVEAGDTLAEAARYKADNDTEAVEIAAEAA